jgi:tRNA (guanine6-N2)-methyltransferase
MKPEHYSLGRRAAPPERHRVSRNRTTAPGRPLSDKWLVSATPGLLSFVEAECARLGIDIVSAQGDELGVQTTTPEKLSKLRTAHACYYPVSLPVARPQGILSCEFHPALQAAFTKVLGLQRSQRFSALRLEGAGNDTATFRRLGDLFSQFTKLPIDAEDGDLVVRVRPNPSMQGWQVLIRTTPRPLATRSWRAVDYQGAVSGPLAAALVALSRPNREDSVVNLACGSSTLLIERLIAAPVASAIGIDIAEEAIRASKSNIAAAAKAYPRSSLPSIQLLTGSFTAVPLPDRSCSVVLCDPPWGELARSLRGVEKQYDGLIKEAHRILRPEGSLCVLTQRPEFILSPCERGFVLEQSLKVSQGGFTPTLLVLRKRNATD